MHLYQYILLAGFFCLLFNKETRFASVVFIAGWFVYLYLAIGVNEVYYYGLSASIELAIAFSLNRVYRIVSYIGYTLIIVNFIGFSVHSIGTDYPYFDVVYAILSSMQLIMLILRANPNGIYRLSHEHPMVRLVNFDSRGTYDRMYRNTQAKGSDR